MPINTGVITQNQISQVSKNADNIPDYNVWTALAKAGMKGYGAYLDARSQQRELRFGATVSRMSAQSARQNAYFADRQAKINARNSINDMYATFRMGEHQAMLQGVQDAQLTHKQQAVTASSGTRMNVGSKNEIDYTNRVSAEINQKSIQENTVRAASQYKLQSVNAEVNGLLEVANYNAQALIAEGDARASDIMAKAVDPLGSGLLAFANSFVSSMVGSKGFGSWGSSGGATFMGGGSSGGGTIGNASSGAFLGHSSRSSTLVM